MSKEFRGGIIYDGFYNDADIITYAVLKGDQIIAEYFNEQDADDCKNDCEENHRPDEDITGLYKVVKLTNGIGKLN